MSLRRTRTAPTTASWLEDYVEPICLTESCIDSGLFNKRTKTREETLSKIIQVFTDDTHHQIAQTRFATIMLRCLHSIRKGSTNEICLATKVIGLLALIIGPGDNGYELYEEFLSTFSETLKFGDEFANVFTCLAILTFVGAKDLIDSERSMKIIWEFLQSNSESNVPPLVLAAAISSWSFLLTTVDGGRLDHKYWQGAIPYFLNLLKEGVSIRIRATCLEALVLIFEMGNVEKFSKEVYETFHQSLILGDTSLSMQEWKSKIGQKLKTSCEPNWEIVNFFEDDYKLDISMNICGNSVKLSTFSQLKKIKFLKKFLGGGFEIHMSENELLQRVFNFIPKDVSTCPELYEPKLKRMIFDIFHWT
ncbi:uncharacterized protein LOC130778874 isoform X2 [Actinidia eriantha]|uniref:uncharacterized protein LOC130778874 isoform X2 n=1 Tax=Actinidia eriantha TaxID=165200 RepID=UPI002588B8FF|nr:uncharacterized protein LOC130778874 isoform X2 [Actinidia eriantha]